MRKGSRKNTSVTRAAGPDHHDLAGFAGFSRHGGVWHHGANVQGRSDGAFAAVLVVEDEVPFFGVAIGAPPPSPRSAAIFVQGRRDVPRCRNTSRLRWILLATGACGTTVPTRRVARSDGAFAAVLVVEGCAVPGVVRKVSRKNTSRNRAAGPDHHDLAGFAGFSRHGGVWHHGANVQGRSDGAFAAVLVARM